jgi:hypothetical protein
MGGMGGCHVALMLVAAAVSGKQLSRAASYEQDMNSVVMHMWHCIYNVIL